MITLSSHAKITKENPMIQVRVYENVPEGEYDVLIVLEQTTTEKKQSLSFSNHNVIIPDDQTFSRNTIYNYDGR